MDVLDRLRRAADVSPVPDVDDAWEAPSTRDLRFFHLVHPGEQVLFQVNVKGDVDSTAIAGFLRFCAGRRDDLWAAAPMVAVPGLALDGFGFDAAVAVLPAAVELTPTSDEDLNRRVYSLFPGWESEVSMLETEWTAYHRARRRIPHSDWSRDPAPILRSVYAFAPRPGVVQERSHFGSASDMDFTLRFVADRAPGRIDCENHVGETLGLVVGDDGVWRTSDDVAVDDPASLLLTFALNGGRR